MDSRVRALEPSLQRNKCSACFRQYNKKEHLVEHMKASFHSVHEPMCGICKKHCRSFESLREHLMGPMPKIECEQIFRVHGCNTCLNILGSPSDLKNHKETCQLSRSGFGSQTPLMNKYTQDLQVVALGCKMLGGGSDGTLDICGRVCLINKDENIIFHTYVKPQIPVTNYRYEMTGIGPDHLRDAMPMKQAQSMIQDILCNGEPIWKIRSKSGRARILVGHGLNKELERLGIKYPMHLIRDTATYPPLMKTSRLSNSLKYLTQSYLGYEIQTGVQDPYEDCVAAMRLYVRMRSQVHRLENLPQVNDTQNHNHFLKLTQKELESMTPDALLEISRSDYYCWCLDSK